MLSDSDWTILLCSLSLFICLLPLSFSPSPSISQGTLPLLVQRRTQCGVALHILLDDLFMVMKGFNVLYSGELSYSL